jgi:hypothetical protein
MFCKLCVTQYINPSKLAKKVFISFFEIWDTKSTSKFNMRDILSGHMFIIMHWHYMSQIEDVLD